MRAMMVMKEAIAFHEDRDGVVEGIRYAQATFDVYCEALNGDKKHHLKLPQYRYITIASMIACEEYLSSFKKD